MQWLESAMQYVIYFVLGLCLVCLLGSVIAFFVLERRWQDGIERDAVAVMERGLYKDAVRADGVSPRQWHELRHRFEEMQIVAEEGDRPLPYKNVA